MTELPTPPTANQLRTANCRLQTVLLPCDIPSPSPYVVRGVAHFHADAVPAAVFRRLRRIAHVVLPAQLVCDPGGGGIEIAGEADDLGSAAAVVGDVSQRRDVDAIVVAAAAVA